YRKGDSFIYSAVHSDTRWRLAPGLQACSWVAHQFGTPIAVCLTDASESLLTGASLVPSGTAEDLRYARQHVWVSMSAWLFYARRSPTCMHRPIHIAERPIET